MRKAQQKHADGQTADVCVEFSMLNAIGKIQTNIFRNKLHKEKKMLYFLVNILTEQNSDRCIEVWNINRIQTPGQDRWEKEMVWLCQIPCSGPEKVLEYLGRYTHRVAISNYRIKSFENGKVVLTWKDRAQNDAVKEMTLDAVEFIRRFLLHVLPKGFKKIRHFGFLSPRYKTRNIELIRKLADEECKIPARPADESVEEMMHRLTGIDIKACPKYGKGRMIRLYELLPVYTGYIVPNKKETAWDTS